MRVILAPKGSRPVACYVVSQSVASRAKIASGGRQKIMIRVTKADTLMTRSRFDKEQMKMSYTKESLIAACVLIASAAGYWYLLGPQSGFSDTDIAAVRGNIKS